MKAFVIILKGDSYSEKVGKRCIDSAERHGIKVETFYGVDKEMAYEKKKEQGFGMDMGREK
jgi:hypothetical protein